MFNLKRTSKRIHITLPRRVAGQSLTEYALIAVLLALAVGGALAATGPAIGNIFSNTIYNVVQGTMTPYDTLAPAEFQTYVAKVATYQEPTQSGGNPGGGGGGGGGGGINLTYTLIAQTAIATAKTAQAKTATALTATAIAGSITATPTPRATNTPGGPTSTATRTSTVTSTATATGTPTITPTPQTFALPIAEQFDNSVSQNDWQRTSEWTFDSNNGRAGSTAALAFAPGGATVSSGNGATYIPLLNWNPPTCSLHPMLQFWSRWNVVESGLKLVVEAANYTGTPPNWGPPYVWSYTQGGSYDYNTAWERINVDLSSFACKPGYTLLRFIVLPQSTMAVTSTWYIDDLSIYDASAFDQTFTTASGSSSACDTNSQCNRGVVSLNAKQICESNCGTGGTSPNYYAGGDWGLNLAVPGPNGQATWAAGGGGGYQSHGDSILEVSQPLDLSSYSTTAQANSQPVVDFYTQYNLATGHTAVVEAYNVSSSTWVSLMTTPPNFSGTSTTWTRYTLSLKPLDGQVGVRVRFHLYALSGSSTSNQNWAITNLYIGVSSGRVGGQSIGGLPFDEYFTNLTNWTTNGAWLQDTVPSNELPPLYYDLSSTYESSKDPAWTANFYHYHLADPVAPSVFTTSTGWTPPTTGLCKTAPGPNCVGTVLGQSEANVMLDYNSTITTGNLAGFNPSDTVANPNWATDAQPDEDFVAEYTRHYTVNTSGVYHFLLYSSGGSRLTIGSTTLTPDLALAYPFTSDSGSNWDASAALHYYSTTLTAGTPYLFTIDYFVRKQSQDTAPRLQFEFAPPNKILHSNPSPSNYAANADTLTLTKGYISYTYNAAQDVYLTFNTRYLDGQAFSGGDSMNVSVSTDDGATWIQVNGNTREFSSSNYLLPYPVNGGSFPGNVANLNDQTSGVPNFNYSTGQTWHTYFVDLSSVSALNISTSTDLMIRFELYTFGSVTQSKGWYIGEVHLFQSSTAP